MKLMKKALSVFMAALMLFSVMSIGLVSYAADSGLSDAYRALAYSFFNYTKDTSLGSNNNVVTKDDAGIPSLTILGDLSKYTTSTESGTYEYAADDGSAIRSVSYTHKVTAQDDGNYTIRNATNILLGIVDNLISYEFGVGLYTVPMLIEEISDELLYFKGDDGEYLFLDGYTYYTDALGNVVARSEEKTYTVDDDGDIVYNVVMTDDVDEEAAELQAKIEAGEYAANTLAEICDIETIVKYMCGNCTSVNSGNWFHDFVFYVYTDIDTVLVTEGEALKSSNLTVYETTVTWTNDRQFDDSGLKAQYYNLGYTKDETSTVSTIRSELKKLDAKLTTYFNTYYADGVLDYATNPMLIENYYPDISSSLALFESISDEAKIAVFGQRAYSYVNLVTQLRPIVGDDDVNKYAPTHTYEKYTDRYGNNIEFAVTAENITTLISNIDALLENKAITKVLGMFLDLSEFGVDLEANNNATPHEVINMIIENMVFSDEILNMLLELVYPMVCNLLDDLITDEFIEETLTGLVDGIDLAAIVDAVADNATSWNALIYGVLASNMYVTLTPAGMAWVWNKYGFTTDAAYSFCDMKGMHDMLKAAKGGINNDGAGHKTDDYYAIGCQYNEYYMDHWRDVDWSQMVWNINGDKNRFLLALDAVLAPLAPLLAVLLGDAESDMTVISVLLMNLHLLLNEGDTFFLYNDVIVPLFETLGITTKEGLITGEKFEENAKVLQSANGRNATTIATFLNDGLLNPLLNWVTGKLLKDPIKCVMELLPNLSYYLTSGALLSSVKAIEIPIRIQIGDGGIKITVYTLKLDELLGDAIAFLDSVQGVLELISFGVDTGVGVVGYYSDAEGSNYNVYTPEDPNYDPEVHKTPTSIAYANAYGEMNLYYTSGEYNIERNAMDADGNYTEWAIRDDVAYLNTETNKIVDNEGVRAVYTPLKEYYTYDVYSEYYDPDLEEIVGRTVTYKVATIDEVPAEYIDSCKKVESHVTLEEDIALPAIMDYKLQACGTLKEIYSCRHDNWTFTDREGGSVTWGDHKRNYIVMELTDDNGTYESYGLVFVFLLRYVLSALGYSQYADGDFVSEYTLLDAFGLDDEMLGDELISGLGVTLGDIVYHVCLNPDAIIASLFELLIGGEEGSLYTTDIINNAITVISGKDYSYAPTTMNTYADEILSAAEEHNDYKYGTAVLYNEYWSEEDGEYVVDNLDDIVENVLAMLKLDDMNSLSGLLEDMLAEYVFNNEMVTMIVSMVYTLLGSLGDIDLETLLYEVLGVDYSKQAMLDSIAYMFNKVDYTKIEMYQKLNAQISNKDYEYTEYSFSNATVDSETGEVIVGTSFDWGFNNPEVTAKYSNSEIFLRALSAAFGPFSILVEYLFMGEDINLLGIVHLPMYEIYHYAWIPLMEALGATDGLVSFRDYYGYVFANEDDKNGDGIEGGTAAFYYLLQPIVRLAENLIASPIETVLNLIPNLIFVLSIGGLNSIINNIAHFAYVLLDILEPIVDVYPILNSFLSNLDLGGIVLNLSLPLDVDLNQLVNELLDGLLGSALSFDIENDNIVLGQQTVEKEVDVPVVDANGNQLYDKATGLPLTTKEMQTVTEDVYAVGTLNITLPYLDLTTLCSGTIQDKTSVAGYHYIYLNSSGGADFITLVLRLVTDTLFYKENWENITNFLIGFCDLDDEDDNDALLMEIMMYIHTKAQDARMNDVLMGLILTIYKVLVPLADNLGTRFKNVDFSVMDMFEDMDNIGSYASALMNAGESKSETLSGFAKIIQMIKDFFANIAKFFQNLFS
ncbi:MAG: hypothetical protein IJZ35_01185 [Clostridia bacterium]|nr:hypothetical protein [Clostridia bacterium]